MTLCVTTKPAWPGAVALLFHEADGSELPGRALTFSANVLAHYPYLCQVGDHAGMGVLGTSDVVLQGAQ